MKYRDVISTCEDEIRQGQLHLALKRIKSIHPDDVPPSDRLALANIARRVGLYAHGLKLLSPIVNSRNESSPAERAEYAVLLHRCGAVKEALEILTQIAPSQVPAVLLFQSFCYFSQWDPEQTVSSLNRYISLETSAYMIIVGKVNLASALVIAGRLTEALDLLNELVVLTKEQNLLRLASNVHELRGQIFLRQKMFSQARSELQEAGQNIHAQANVVDLSWIRKWQAILSALESSELGPIREFRVKALEAGDCETVRELDRFSLQVHFDRELFEYLVFGTPYRAYRETLCRELSQIPSAVYDFRGQNNFNGAKAEYERTLEIETGRVGDAEILVPGKKCHQLISVLTSDFYRSFRVGELFSELFTDEKYNIYSSPSRVRQLINRSRKEIKEYNLPIKIRVHNMQFSISFAGPFSIRIPYEYQKRDSNDVYLAQLLKAFGQDAEFSAADACQFLSLTRSTFQRFSQSAVESGKLKKMGSSNATLYKVVS